MAALAHDRSTRPALDARFAELAERADGVVELLDRLGDDLGHRAHVLDPARDLAAERERGSQIAAEVEVEDVAALPERDHLPRFLVLLAEWCGEHAVPRLVEPV